MDERLPPWDPHGHVHEDTTPHSASDAAVFRVTCGRIAGHVIPLEGLPMVFGRSRDADVVFDDASVSRRHAELVEREGQYVLRDLGSMNGLYVNGQRVDEAVLRHGDELRLGRFCVSFLHRV